MGAMNGIGCGPHLDSHLQMFLIPGVARTADKTRPTAEQLLAERNALLRNKTAKKNKPEPVVDAEKQMAFNWDFIFEEEVHEGETQKLAPEAMQSQEDLEDWTEEEMTQLHYYVLEQSMIQVLNPRSSKATRVEILEWVDRITPYKEKAKPFSFDACCRFSGYDPEELREHLHDEMKFRGIHPNPKSK